MMTDNALDLAIEGTGFFQVLADRIAYTRNGAFSRNRKEHWLLADILFSLKFRSR